MKLVSFILLILLTVGCADKNGNQNFLDISSQYMNEEYRPQIHFSPESQWMNDPNGMVYYEGEYHLFYQYYPDSNVWGPMHWGHAISEDLVNWEHMPIALYPDSLGYIFSGSAVVDWNNTSGFGKDSIPPMIAIYTYHDPVGEKEGRIDYQTQGIAYSLDKGRTWTKYEGNPVLSNPGIRDFRDPKVRWYEPQQKWIMTLAVKDRIGFYSSKDMKSWKHESDFQPEIGAYGGVWECPDLFPLTNEQGEKKWVLLVSINPGAPNGGSGTQYFVGNFNGQEFVNENENLYWLDYGKDNYAGVTWSDVPEEDGRTLFMGWMSNWQYATVVPTNKWRSAMTLPRKLELKSHNNDYMVISKPVNELKKLRKEEYHVEATLATDTMELFDDIVIPCELTLTFEKNGGSQFGNASEYGIAFTNDTGEELSMGYETITRQLYINRFNAGKKDFSDKFATEQVAPYEDKDIKSIQIYLDRSSIEVFVNDGEAVLTSLVFPNNPFHQIKVFAKNGSIKINNVKMYSLHSIWNTEKATHLQ